MDSTHSPPRPQRAAVLVLSHPDGYIEAFADPHIDVRFARVPVAHSRQAEVVAEDLAEQMLPRRYRDLYRRDRLRANGSTKPLTADAMLGAFTVLDLQHTLDSLPAMFDRGAVA